MVVNFLASVSILMAENNILIGRTKGTGRRYWGVFLEVEALSTI